MTHSSSTLPSLIGPVVTKLGLWSETSTSQLEQAGDEAWARARRLAADPALDPDAAWVRIVVRRECVKVLAADTLRVRVRRALLAADARVRGQVVRLVGHELVRARMPWSCDPLCWDLSAAADADPDPARGRLVALGAAAIALADQELGLRRRGIDPLDVARRLADLVTVASPARCREDGARSP